MTENLGLQPMRRPPEIVVVSILGYLQAGYATVIGIIFLAASALGTIDELEQTLVLATGITLLLAGVIIAAVTTGVFVGSRPFRWIMLFALAISLWSSISTMLTGEPFIFYGIAHAIVAVVTGILLFTPAASRWFNQV